MRRFGELCARFLRALCSVLRALCSVLRALCRFLEDSLLTAFFSSSLSSSCSSSSSFSPSSLARAEARTGRHGSDGGVVDLHVRARSAGEGSRATEGVGARRDHADSRGREDSTDPKGSRDSFSFIGVLCK